MNIRIVSDLHLEFSHYELPVLDNEKEQILVLAGDCHVNSKLIRPFFVQKTNEYLESYLEEYSRRFKAVLYIFGNHEYYGSCITRLPIRMQEKISEIELTNVHMLNCSEIIIDDVRFLGSTLWSDFNNRDPLCLFDASQYMNDYRKIRIENFRRKFTPADALRIFDTSMLFFKKKMEEPFTGKTVIITHHAPTRFSIAERYKNDTIANGWYVSNLENFILDNKPNLWIHGHMHNFSDYMIDSCRVICNPKGYPGECTSFKDDLIIGI